MPSARALFKPTVIALLLLLARHANASAAPATVRSIVLVLVDGMSLADIDPGLAPNLSRLASIGAVGLMNARTAKTLEPEHTYVTLGAGTRAQGPPEVGHAFNSSERVEDCPAASAYARNTGEPVPPAGSVVHPYIALIARVNSDAHYEIVPGALGGALRRTGKRTAVFGNSDTAGCLGRHAVAIAMDERGVTDLGDVGRAMAARNPDFPGGLATNSERLGARVVEAVGEAGADFVVVETGDAARVERYARAGLLTQAAEKRARRLALSSADTLVGHLLKSLDLTSTLLIVLAPAPAAKDITTGHSLAPIIAAGGGLPSGLVTSPTTRREGLVANTDIAASVLAYLGVSLPPWILGTPMRVTPEPAPLARLISLHDRIASISLVRPPMLKAFIGLQIVVAIASLLSIGVIAMGQTPRKPRFPRKSRFPRLVRVLLAFLGAVPLAWLVMPLVAPLSLASIAIWTLVLALLIYGVARTVFPMPSRAFAAIYLATGLAIMADALLGAELMKDSVLGYDLVGGARFFGIGNEYMGALVGSLIAGSGLALDGLGATGARRKAALAGIALVFVLATMVLASPSIGANMGGTLTAAAGFGTAYLLFARKGVTRREAGFLALLALLLVVGVAIADSLRPGGPVSHWGRTVLLARSGGAGTLVNAIQRKAAMNLKLIRYTAWTRALLVFLGAVAFLWIRPVGLTKRVMKAHPGFASGFAASLIAVLVALLANDSGVVVAAMVTLYPFLVLLHLAGEEASRDV
ncbi:MAG: hypothetical protein AB1774_07315 [Bacillota bacterium]